MPEAAASARLAHTPSHASSHVSSHASSHLRPSPGAEASPWGGRAEATYAARRRAFRLDTWQGAQGFMVQITHTPTGLFASAPVPSLAGSAREDGIRQAWLALSRTVAREMDIVTQEGRWSELGHLVEARSVALAESK